MAEVLMGADGPLHLERVLEMLFDQLSGKIPVMRYAAMLMASRFDSVDRLQSLTIQRLQQLGVVDMHAQAIWRVIFSG